MENDTWARRLAALQTAADAFVPDIFSPEDGDQKLGAFAFHGMLSDIFKLAKTYVSPTPKGFIRVVVYDPPVEGDFESSLVMQVRPIPNRSEERKQDGPKVDPI